MTHEKALREVRVFHDFNAPWPLWESGTDKYSMDPEDYDLSQESIDLMRRSTRLYEEGIQPPDYDWVSPEKLHEYLDVMRQVVAQLRMELAGVAVVKDEVYRG